MNRKTCLILLFFLTILSSSICFSIEYEDSKPVYEIHVQDVIQTDDKYFLEFKVENKVGQELILDTQLVYRKDQIIAGKDKFTCSQSECFFTIQVKKVFFDKYRVVAQAKYQNRYYEDKKTFEILLDQPDIQLALDKTVLIEPKVEPQVSGEIIVNSDITNPIEYTLEIFPLSKTDFRQYYTLTCVGSCKFQFSLMQPYVLDDYQVNLYSSIGETYDIFNLKYNTYLDYKANNTYPQDFFYNNYNRKYLTKVDLKKNGKQKQITDISVDDFIDLEINILEGNVKKIRANNTQISQTKIGFEYVPRNKVKIDNRVVNNLFAINPVFSDTVSQYQIDFVASGYQVYKCTQYDFETQNCYGDFTKILDTIPGVSYTLTLTPVDPIFAETISLDANDGTSRDGVFDYTANPLQVGNDNKIIADSYFRFENLNIPPGSTITSATITFTSASAQTRTSVLTNIYALSENNCNHFDTSAGGDNPIDNTLTTNFVAWDNIASWSTGENSANTVTPDISTIIQEVVDGSGWQSGNSMCFTIKDDGSTRRAFREMQTITLNPPQIYIDYVAPPISILWNYTTLELEGIRGSQNLKDAQVLAVFDNDNVKITPLGGNGSSFISVDTTDLGTILDGANEIVTFNCSPSVSQPIGVYQAIFKVNSTQDPTGATVTISCSVFDEAKLVIDNPTSLTPMSVQDGQEITINASYMDKYSNEIFDNFDIVDVKVGNISVNISSTTALQFIAEYSISAQSTKSRGITVYGNRMWVTDEASDTVEEYYTDGTYIQSYDISAYTGLPKGITTYDSQTFYVVDDTNNRVLVLSSSFSLISTFSIAGQIGSGYGIATNSTHLFIADAASSNVFVYDTSGTYLSTITTSTYTSSAAGITVFEDEMWINDGTTIDHFHTNGTYIETIDVTAQTKSTTGLSTIDGYQFYIADERYDSVVHYKKTNIVPQGDHFEFNIILPYGLALAQDLYVEILSYADTEEYFSTLEAGALIFPEKDPPQSITNLQNISRTANSIFWSWINPSDLDFDHVELWLNGVFFANTSSNFYNVTGLTPDTQYTLSTRTVDNKGNINYTWVNSTATTISIPKVENITPINTTLIFQNSSILITANVTDKFPISLVQAYVQSAAIANYYTMTDIDLDGVYEYNFTDTLALGQYNITIIAQNSYGGINNTQTTYFNVISDTPFIDTYIEQANPTTSHENDLRLGLNGVAGSVERTLIQFDISYVPTGVVIDSAIMRLFAVNSKFADLNVGVYAISESWEENTTWNTQPNYDSQLWASQTVSAKNNFYDWDITGLVNNWYNSSISNYGVLLKEIVEASNGLKEFASSESGSNVPSLVLSYTDIAPPDVQDVQPAPSPLYRMLDNVTISAKVTDNIGVSKVYANVSWDSSSELIELISIGGFIYQGNFTNTKHAGQYNIRIIANDTSNLINDSETSSFFVQGTHLSLQKEINKINNNQFQISIDVFNLANLYTTPDKNIVVYSFIPNTFNLSSNFYISNSSWYNTAITNETLNDSLYNGTIYQWVLSNKLANKGVFNLYSGAHNSTNSWNIVFNVTGNNLYKLQELFLVGLDPQLKRLNNK